MYLDIIYALIEAKKNALYKSNTTLFNNLLSESKKTFPELAQQIEAMYSGKKEFSPKDRAQELVTQALSRHFSKEYETNPTQPWYKSVKDFLKWFSDVIKDVYKNLMGGTLKLNVGFIKSDMTMSDISKMLNTSEFEFRLDINPLGDRMVQYSLSEGMQKLVDTAKDRATTTTQSKIINRILNQVEDADDIFDSLGASRVTLDTKSNDEANLLSAFISVYNSKPLLNGTKGSKGHIISEGYNYSASMQKDHVNLAAPENNT